MMKICNFSYHIYGSRVKSAFGPSGPSGWSLSRFYSMKQLRVFLHPLPPWQDARSITGLSPSIKFASTHLYTWVERHWESKVWLTQEHNSTQCPRPRLEPGPLAPESSALTMRPLHLPPYLWPDQNFNTLYFTTIVWQLSVSQHIIFEKVTFSKQHTGTIQD